MKIGDIIARKDMPSLKCLIVGENAGWDEFWDVEAVGDNKERLGSGMVAKDDDRWKVVATNKDGGTDEIQKQTGNC